MKKKKILAFLIVVAVCLVPFIAKAEPVEIKNPLGANANMDVLIKNFVFTVLSLSGVLALVAFIYGGLMWLISMGDTAKITKGKNVMIWAVVGLAVIFGSYAIISLVYTAMGIK